MSYGGAINKPKKKKPIRKGASSNPKYAGTPKMGGTPTGKYAKRKKS